MKAGDGQAELPFEGGSGSAGLEHWQQQRRETIQQLARDLGLPIGHRAEVWLRGGIVLRGVLRLREELLFVEEHATPALELRIDAATFTPAEIESCVRLD